MKYKNATIARCLGIPSVVSAYCPITIEPQYQANGKTDLDMEKIDTSNLEDKDVDRLEKINSKINKSNEKYTVDEIDMQKSINSANSGTLAYLLKHSDFESQLQVKNTLTRLKSLNKSKEKGQLYSYSGELITSKKEVNDKKEIIAKELILLKEKQAEHLELLKANKVSTEQKDTVANSNGNGEKENV